MTPPPPGPAARRKRQTASSTLTGRLSQSACTFPSSSRPSRQIQKHLSILRSPRTAHFIASNFSSLSSDPRRIQMTPPNILAGYPPHSENTFPPLQPIGCHNQLIPLVLVDRFHNSCCPAAAFDKCHSCPHLRHTTLLPLHHKTFSLQCLRLPAAFDLHVPPFSPAIPRDWLTSSTTLDRRPLH